MLAGAACAPLYPTVDPCDPADAEQVAVKVCPQCPVQEACGQIPLMFAVSTRLSAVGGMCFGGKVWARSKEM